MKILLAVQKNGLNSLVPNLEKGLRMTATQTVCSLEKFWSPSLSDAFDIIHIQWPEALLEWAPPTEKRLKKLKNCLSLWKKKGVKIIVTRHNFLPHKSHPLNEKLYKLTYQAADGIIHMGEFCKKDFFERHSDIRCQHTIIPHPVYESTPNEVSGIKARKTLRLSSKHIVFLVFGNIREVREQQMVIEAFQKLSFPNKQLLIPNGKLTEKPIVPKLKKPVKYIQRSASRILNYLKYRSMGIRIEEKFIPEEQIQYYFKASDIVIIQRIENLNSGNVPLGFTFGKVVIGPDVGNISEILRETQNLVYIPGDTDDLLNAMNQSISLLKKGHGSKNQEYAYKEWNIEKVGRLHKEFYDKLVLTHSL